MNEDIINKMVKELEEPINNTIPNTFNYKKYLNNNDIYYLINIDNISIVDNNVSIIYKLRNYINKIDNLYCIGRNGTHSYNNMDHSILSGFICADMIKDNDHDLNKLWNVNVDKSYQEEK